MSLATWKALYYPVPASEVSPQDALAHSIRKWEGLAPEILEQHGITLDGGLKGETGEPRFYINDKSCALCECYIQHDVEEESEKQCTPCPLYQYLGLSCDRLSSGPFAVWITEHDPKPMLTALLATQERELKRAQEQTSAPS